MESLNRVILIVVLLGVSLFVSAADVTKINTKTNSLSADWVVDNGAMSADNQWAIFTSRENYYGDMNTSSPRVYLRNLLQGRTYYITQPYDTNTGYCCDSSRRPDISADASHAFFLSYAPNLVPDDTNGVEDLFIFKQSSVSGIPKNTQNIYYTANLDSRRSVPSSAFDLSNSNSFNFHSDVLIHSVNGQSFNLRIFFRKKADNNWEIYGALDNKLIKTDAGVEVLQTITFNPDGTVLSVSNILLSASLLNNTIGTGSPFTDNLLVQWQNPNTAATVTQLPSDFEVLYVKQDGRKFGEITRLTNNDGEQFDRGVIDYWIIGETNDFFFTSGSSNVVSSTSSHLHRLYKYTASSNQVTLVAPDFDNIFYIDHNLDASKVLVKSTRELTGLRNYSDDLYWLDLSTGDFTIVERPDFIQSYSQIESAILNTEGNKIVVMYRNLQTALYDLSNSQVFDYTEKLKQYYNINHLVGFAANSNAFVANSDYTYGETALWYYDLDVNEGYRYTLSDTNQVITGIGRPSAYSNRLIYREKHCYSSCGLFAVDVATATEAVPSISSWATATTDLVGKIDLQYETVPGAVNYLVYRYKASTPDNKKYIGSSVTNSISDSASGLEPNIEYHYDIIACNRLFQCNVGKTVVGAFVNAPNKVTGLNQIVGSTLTYRTISWDKQVDARYKLTLRDGLRKREIILGTNNSYALNLDYNQAYQVSVKACVLNLCGLDSDALIIDAITGIPKPAGFHYFISDNLDSFTFKWKSAQDATYYKVYGQINNGQRIFRKKVFKAEFNETIVSLGNRYTYYVSACTYENVCSQESITKFEPSERTLKVEQLKLSVIPEATFAKVKLYSTGYSRMGYERIRIYRRSDRFAQGQLIKEVNTGLFDNYSYTFNDRVSPDTSYYYYAQGCINQVCQVSSDIEFKGIDSYASGLGKVSDLQASQREFRDNVKLTWTSSQRATSQKLLRKMVGHNSFSTLAILSSTTAEYYDFGVKPGRVYEYKIVPYLNNSSGDDSNIAIGEIFYDQGVVWTPDKPMLKTALDRYYDRITVSWNRIENIAQYEIYTSDSLEGEYVAIAQTRYLTYTINSLKPGTKLYFKLKACTSFACSDFSAPLLTSTSTAISAPPQATEPVLELNSNNDIKIIISEVPGASYYKINRYRSLLSAHESQRTSEDLEYIDIYTNTSTRYFFRISACNAFGCSSFGQYAEINTALDPVLSERRKYNLVSASQADEEKIVLKVSSSNNGEAPAHVNIYVAESEQGTKSLFKKITENYASAINYPDAVTNQKYYFWLENCYSGECQLDPRYRVGLKPASVVPVIPKPEGFTATKGKSLNQITFSWLRPIAGVTVEIFEQEGTQYVATASSTYLLRHYNVQTEPYKYKVRNYKARNCYLGNCSEFSDLISGWVAPIHTQSSSLAENSGLWLTPHSSTLIEGVEGFNLASSIRPTQELYYADGYTLDTQIFLKKSNPSSLICSDVSFEVSSGLYSGRNPYMNNKLIQIVYLSPGCQNQYLTDVGSYYLIFNEDHTTATKIEIPEGKWFDLSLSVTSTNTAAVKLAGQQVIKQLVDNQLSPDFGKLILSSDYYNYNNATYVRMTKFASAADFEQDRPFLDRSINAHNINLKSVIRWSGSVLGDSSQIKVLKIVDNKSLQLFTEKSVTSDIWSDDSIVLPPVSAKYLVLVRRCLENLCSRYSYSIINVSGPSISSPSISLVTDSEIGTIKISWLAVTDAHNYDIYAGQINNSHMPKIENTQGLSFTLNDPEDGTWYLRIKACSSLGSCSYFSNTISGSRAIDSDGDGLNDAVEIIFGTDPYDSDTDDDGLSDKEELTLGSDPTLPDTDGDGMNDAFENDYGFNPIVNDAHSDADSDGLSNIQEMALGTNPIDPDSDGDGVNDSLDIEPMDAATSYVTKFGVIQLGDMNTNGINDLGFFVKNKINEDATLIGFDGNDRSVLNIFSQSDSEWSVHKAIKLGDMNDDGVSEIGFYATNRKNLNSTLTVFNGATKSELRQFALASKNWQIKDVIVLGDMDSDGVTEIGFAGTNRATGNSSLVIFNGSNGTVVNIFALSSNDWNVENIFPLGDMTGDDISEVGFYAFNNTSGTPTLISFDGSNKSLVNMFSMSHLTWDVHSARVMQDMNGDSIPEIGFYTTNRTNLNRTMIVLSGSNKSLLGLFALGNANWDVIDVKVINDMTGDQTPELGFYSSNRTSGNPTLVVINGASKALVKLRGMDKNVWSVKDIDSYGDLSGDEIPEIGFYAINKNSGNLSLIMFNGATKGVENIFALDKTYWVH